LILVPVLLRALGIRLPLWPFSPKARAKALLTLPIWQCVLIDGVLFDGGGMLILQTLFDWIYEKKPFAAPSGKALFISVGFSMFGVVRSYDRWHRSREPSAKSAENDSHLPPART